MNFIVRCTISVAAILVVLHLGSAAAAAQTADLSVEKYTFADPAAAGADFSYFMTVYNNGPDTAHNVLMTDVMPAGVSFNSAQTSPDGLLCTFNATVQTLTCNLGNIVAYDAVFVEVSVRAPSYAGTIVNTANVSSSTPDPNLDDTGLPAFGLSSGTAYRAMGTSRYDRSLNLVFGGWFPYAFNQVDNVRLVGSGGQHLLLHENFHLTIGVDGTATTVFDNPVIVCK